MERKTKTYFEKKVLLILSLSLFFILLIPFLEADAQWTAGLIDLKMSINSETIVNINNYCTNCNHYWITFRNPDNLIQVIGAKSSNPITYTNSYFSFKLTSDGKMEFTSQNKEVDVQFSVYASENGVAPQTYQYFYLRIRKNLKPIQINSFISSIQLEGNNSYSVSLLGYYTQSPPNTPTEYIIILKEGADEVALSSALPSCNSELSILFCITSTSNPVLSLRGQNITSNLTLKITAVNYYGINTAPIISVNTIGRGQYGAVPFRGLSNLANLSLKFNQTDGKVFTSIDWSNFTYIAVVFPSPTTGVNVTINSSLNSLGNSSAIYPEFFITATWNGVFLKSNFTNYNIPLYIFACNNNGCDSTNNILNVNILGDVPEIITPSGDLPEVITLVMAHHQYKAIDFKDYISDFDTINLSWFDGYEYFNLSTPTTISSNRSYPTSFGYPFYEIEITFSNIIQFTSADENTNFIINGSACNSEGCISLSPIYFYIQGGSDPEIVSQVNSGPWRTISTTFLNLYPESDGLNTKQKVGIMILTIFTISIIFLFVFNNSEIEGSTKVYSLLFINSLVFLFFMVKGYVPVVVPATMAGLILLFFILKFRKGDA